MKPSWYLSVNPKGTVPCLVLEDGSVLDESMDIVEFVASNFTSGPSLLPDTDDEKEKHKELMDGLSVRYPALYTRTLKKLKVVNFCSKKS